MEPGDTVIVSGREGPHILVAYDVGLNEAADEFSDRMKYHLEISSGAESYSAAIHFETEYGVVVPTSSVKEPAPSAWFMVDSDD